MYPPLRSIKLHSQGLDETVVSIITIQLLLPGACIDSRPSLFDNDARSHEVLTSMQAVASGLGPSMHCMQREAAAAANLQPAGFRAKKASAAPSSIITDHLQ